MPKSNNNRIEADDLYKISTIPSARLSPNGERIVFCLKEITQKGEEKTSHLWIYCQKKKQARQFTYGKQSDSFPSWSPDGTRIAFLSDRADREKPPQIFLIHVDGGEAAPLTNIPGSIHSFEWSPDGHSIVCCVTKTDDEENLRQNDPEKKRLGVISRHYDRLFYKLDGHGYLPKERSHLWIVNTRNGKARQITDHPVFDELFPTWSPDGKSIAFISNRSNDPDAYPEMMDLFIIPAAGGDIRKIDTPIGEKSRPMFSSDNKWIAYYCTPGAGEWYRNQGLYVVPSSGLGAANNLTAAHDLHCSAFTINDIGSPEFMAPIWSVDGKWLYFQVDFHGSTVLKRISIDGADVEHVAGNNMVLGSISFNQSQDAFSAVVGTMEDPCQVCTFDMHLKEFSQITSINSRLISKANNYSYEEMWFKGKISNDLQGWIVKPPDFNPDRKYPVILMIHGGPLTQYGFFFMHEFYFLAGKGYIVAFCNPRGGRGYGEEHARGIWQSWGTADYNDIMSWADHLETLPFIDSSHMGVGGGSYGGYMTNWIIGHTDRFKAAITMRCVSNFISMWGSSDFNWTFQQELGDKTPFEDVNQYWERSPIKYFGNVKTPTLVIHNENDMRCPIEQGEQVFVSLKRIGVPTEFVRFPDEFHGLSRNGRTDRRIARLNHICRWFDKYLKVEA